MDTFKQAVLELIPKIRREMNIRPDEQSIYKQIKKILNLTYSEFQDSFNKLVEEGEIENKPTSKGNSYFLVNNGNKKSIEDLEQFIDESVNMLSETLTNLNLNSSPEVQQNIDDLNNYLDESIECIEKTLKSTTLSAMGLQRLSKSETDLQNILINTLQTPVIETPPTIQPKNTNTPFAISNKSKNLDAFLSKITQELICLKNEITEIQNKFTEKLAEKEKESILKILTNNLEFYKKENELGELGAGTR